MKVVTCLVYGWFIIGRFKVGESWFMDGLWFVHGRFVVCSLLVLVGQNW